MSRFQEIFKNELIAQCNELIERHDRYINWLNGENRRNTLLLTKPSRMKVKTPASWHSNRLFDPHYVKSRSEQISRSVVDKLISGKYRPNDPHIRTIPKPGGGLRKIGEFQIPDSTVSDLYFHKLLSENKHRFSSYSYAYRDDRNVHYAIQELHIGMREKYRLFIAEFDFSKFFDSISHAFIEKQLSSNGLLVTGNERIVLQSFLRSTNPNGVGIPQGASISLFLANVACCQLDRRLEELGVRFVRYADDTVIWSNSYQSICSAVDAISDFSQTSEISINFRKSDGISLLTMPSVKAELASRKTYIDFIGYRLSSSKVSIKPDSVSRIKKRISQIINRCMLSPLRANKHSKGRRLYSIPSFLRVKRAISMRVLSDGVDAAMHPKSNKYNYKIP